MEQTRIPREERQARAAAASGPLFHRVNGLLLDRLGGLCGAAGRPASGGTGSGGNNGNRNGNDSGSDSGNDNGSGSGNDISGLDGGMALDNGGVCSGQRVWARATGTDTHIDGNHGAPDARDKRYGFLAGLDKYLSNGATAGLAVGYSHADVTEDTGDARAKLDTLRLAAYAGKRLGAVNVAGTLGYAYDFISTTRSFGSLGKAEGSGHGQLFSAGAQASLPWALGRATLTPRIGLRYAHLDGFDLSENGPTSQNLDVDAQHADSLQPYVPSRWTTR